MLLPALSSLAGPATPAGVLATGDFNGDGFDDLAIGVPSEDLAGENDAGAVHVIYGSAARLSANQAVENQFLREGAEQFPGAPAQGNQFGACVTMGDFNGDGFDDLAIGVPGMRINGNKAAGAVYVVHGSAAGLDASTAALWHQDVASVRNSAKANDAFGSALSSGDFNNDGYADLAIGSPNERIAPAEKAGGVNVLFGSASGISADGNIYLTQNNGGLDDSAEFLDHFGAALCTGDFNGDGFDDLAIASPDETIDIEIRAGAVHVVYGNATGFDQSASQFWHQDSPGVHNRSETRDGFGSALASGDFDNDGFDDLAIGVPGEDTNEIVDCGLVHVLYGRLSGLTAAGSQVWQQDNADLRDARQPHDRFGAALACGDFDGDGFSDLAIGVPGERIGSRDNCGATNILYGSAARLTPSNSQFWHQNVYGVFEVCQPDDAFGTSLAVGDFDGNGRDDLANGVPGEDVGTAPVVRNAGAVHVIYGTGVGLAPGPDQLWTQDSPGIRNAAQPNDSLGGSAQ